MNEIEERILYGKKLKSFKEVYDIYTKEEKYQTNNLQQEFAIGSEDVDNTYFSKKVDIKCAINYSRIKDCVFEEDVIIDLSEENSRIELNCCVFKQTLTIKYTGNTNNKSIVEIMACRVNKMVIATDISKFELFNNLIYRLVTRASLSYVLMESNIIYQFWPHEKVSQKDGLLLFDNDFKEKFNRYDLSEDKIEKILLKRKRRRTNESSGNIDISKYYFYDAMISNSDARYNRNKYANYLYEKSLANTSNKMSKLFIRLTRGFCRPGIFVIYLLFTFFASALAYLELGNRIVKDAVSLVDALYYSGLTITTLGYGDKLGKVNELTDTIKMISIGESFIGLLLATCLLTAVFNKYTD